MNYRIGLYLDNDKIGWAAIRENEEGHAEHIERVGVRFFPYRRKFFQRLYSRFGTTHVSTGSPTLHPPKISLCQTARIIQ